MITILELSKNFKVHRKTKLNCQFKYIVDVSMQKINYLNTLENLAMCVKKN